MIITATCNIRLVLDTAPKICMYMTCSQNIKSMMLWWRSSHTVRSCGSSVDSPSGVKEH